MDKIVTEKDTNQKTPFVKKPFVKKQGGDSAGKGSRPPRNNAMERPKAEYEQKIISIRRVTRVVAGGRRFTFSVAVVIGDQNGKVGVGQGKAGDTSLAIQKAYNEAKKNLVFIKTGEKKTIPYDVKAKFNSAIVYLMPNESKGLVAGSSIRTVLTLAGITDVSGKVISRSKNQVNNAKATIKALSVFSAPIPLKEKNIEIAEEKENSEKELSDKKFKNK